jgi:hypothetical protein
MGMHRQSKNWEENRAPPKVKVMGEGLIVHPKVVITVLVSEVRVLFLDP